MNWRSLQAAVLAACALALADRSAAQDRTQTADVGSREASIRYVPMDAPPGMSQAVIVEGSPLVYTRQLLPLDASGQLVGQGSVDQQIEQVLDNLEAVLMEGGSQLDKLIRVHVYALAPATLIRVRERLVKRLSPTVRPAITSVLTPLPRRGAVVALDAVAASTATGDDVVLKRCAAVSGEAGRADAAILPQTGVAYVSGQPDSGGLTESAVVRAMSQLMKTLEYLQLSPQHVVQVKIFLRPMTSAEAVIREVEKFFPDQTTPPLVCVEWLASVPIEIELVAQLPASDPAGEDIQYVTPPGGRPSPTFSKVALVRTDRQIFISGQCARVPSRGEPQAKYVFAQLQEILDHTGSDMRHLAKATYYVCDHDAARWVDRTRPSVLDPDRPPAASKVTVHGTGVEGRTMTIDLIAIPRE